MIVVVLYVTNTYIKYFWKRVSAMEGSLITLETIKAMFLWDQYSYTAGDFKEIDT